MKTKNQKTEIKQYIKAVEKHLRLPREIRSRVLSDLETGIMARSEAGESDGAILASMGTPKQMAEELNEEMGEFAYTKSPWRWACLALSVGCAVILLFKGAAGLYQFLINVMMGRLGVIGGADGPTQIYIAAAQGYDMKSIVLASILLIAGLLGFYKLGHCRKHEEKESENEN